MCITLWRGFQVNTKWMIFQIFFSSSYFFAKQGNTMQVWEDNTSAVKYSTTELYTPWEDNNSDWNLVNKNTNAVVI